MPRRALATLSLTWCLSGCASVRSTSPKEIPDDTDFEVRAADPVHISGTRLTLTVASIADSRCPTDVTCITAGDAMVILVLTGDADRTDTLHTGRSLRRETTYAGHRVTLTDVRPYARTTERNRVQTAVLLVTPLR